MAVAGQPCRSFLQGPAGQEGHSSSVHRGRGGLTVVCQVATDSPHTSHYLPRARGPYRPDLRQSRHAGQGRTPPRGPGDGTPSVPLSRTLFPAHGPAGRKAAFREIFPGTCLGEQRVPCQAMGSDSSPPSPRAPPAPGSRGELDAGAEPPAPAPAPPPPAPTRGLLGWSLLEQSRPGAGSRTS